jgi:hypothetical protein
MTIYVDSALHEDDSNVPSACDSDRFSLHLPEVYARGYYSAIDNGNPLVGVVHGEGIIVGVCPIHILHISWVEGRHRRVFLFGHMEISLTPGYYAIHL